VVGLAGFEPTTPCPPGRCATRLRYSPFMNGWRRKQAERRLASTEKSETESLNLPRAFLSTGRGIPARAGSESYLRSVRAIIASASWASETRINFAATK
jgi:hypothetical protein